MQQGVFRCRYDGLRKTMLKFCNCYKNELSVRMIHIRFNIDEKYEKCYNNKTAKD